MWYGLAVLLMTLRAFVLLRVFATLLGAEGYGIFSQANITVQVLAPVLSLRLSMASIRFLAGERDLLKASRVWMTMLAAVVTAVVVWLVVSAFLLAPLAAVVFGDPSLKAYGLVVSLWAAVAAVNFYVLNYFRTVRAIDKFSMFRVAQAFVEIVVLIAVVVLGGTVLQALWALVGVAALLSVILFAAVRRQLAIPIRVKLQENSACSSAHEAAGQPLFDWSALPSLLRYSLPLVPNVLLLWLVQAGARYVIVHNLGLAPAGVYSASYTVANLLAILSGPLTFVLFPTVSKAWADGERREVRKYFVYSNKIYLVAALPAGMGLVVVSPILLRMLTGQEFVAGPTVLLPIVVAVILAGLYQINLYSIHLVRRTERLFWVLFVAAAISLGMSVFLVPWLGLSGAAIATATAFAVLATVILVWSRKEIQLRLDYAFVTKCLLAALLMAGLLTLVPASGLQGLIIQTILGIAIYLVLILVMRVFSATEVQAFRQLLPALRARVSL